MNKSLIRQNIKKQRDSLTSEYINQESQKITKSIIDNIEVILPNFQNKVIALYLSSNKEVDTKFLLEYFLQQKSTIICLPKINPKDDSMDFVEYNINDKLEKNSKYLSISEPSSNKKIIPQIIFTPLIACDKFGNRIGMGKGFYDKKIQKIKQSDQNITLIGLSYDFQLVDQIIASNSDQTLDFIGLPQYIIDSKTQLKVKNSKKDI